MTDIKDLTRVQLLIEIDNRNSSYNKGALLEELERRNFIYGQPTGNTGLRQYLLDQRNGEDQLSLIHKILLVLSPFIKPKNNALIRKITSLEYATFYQLDEDKAKMEQVKRFRTIGVCLWIAIFLIINIIYLGYLR